jgi:hypothetical protein
MIRYRYVDTLKPAAPFVNVNLRNPASDAQREGQPALIDSAADRTVLSGPASRKLGLIEDGRLPFQGFAGEIIGSTISGSGSV